MLTSVLGPVKNPVETLDLTPELTRTEWVSE